MPAKHRGSLAGIHRSGGGGITGISRICEFSTGKGADSRMVILLKEASRHSMGKGEVSG